MLYLFADCETQSGRAGALVRFGALCLAFGITAPELMHVEGAGTFAYKLDSLNGLPDDVIVTWARTFAVSLEVRGTHTHDGYPVRQAGDIGRGARSVEA